MSWKERSLKAGGCVRVGRRTISVPSVPSMTDPDRPTQASRPAGDSDRQPPIDRDAVQHLDRVRAMFRPTSSDHLAPGLERFIGREDIFRRVGEADMASHGTQAMMQCPPNWPSGVTWVPIRDLEILEILEDQDIGRADAGFTPCEPRGRIEHDQKETPSKSRRAGESWPAADHGAGRDVDDGPESRRADDDGR